MRVPARLSPFLVGLVLVVGVAWVLAPSALARRERTPTVVQVQDGAYLRLHLEADEAAQGWLRCPPTDDPDEISDGGPAADLVVVLHGHGADPRGFMQEPLMDARGAYCLAVAGHTAVRNERGAGFAWGGGDVAYIVALTKHVVATYPIHKDRIVVWGHSAGGSMTLATLAAAPELFAGGLTTAAPATPSGAHKDLRVCVFLGKDDPNWAGATSVRAHVDKLLGTRAAKGACAFFAVEDLGHDVPYPDYLNLGFDWILHGKARGGEAAVPRRSRGGDGAWRHILLRTKDAEGAEGVTRSEAKATRALRAIRKEVERGRAYFAFEAACHSEHTKTASCGGGIDADALQALVGPLPDLEPEQVSDPLVSPQGLHLVWRAPPEPDDD